MEEGKMPADLKEVFSNNIKKGLQKIFVSIGTIALEALVIMFLWNYVFPDLALNYGRTLALLVIARMIARTSK